MVNASFVFGMDEDDNDTFDQTVDWAVKQGIETATFHILTPYPDTPLFKRMQQESRITTYNWDLYDTRHAVYQPRRMSVQTLEAGYWRAYRDFYSWSNILQSSTQQVDILSSLRHFAYKAAWKKFDPFWDWVIRIKRVSSFTQLLELVLSEKQPAITNEAEKKLDEVAFQPESWI